MKRMFFDLIDRYKNSVWMGNKVKYTGTTNGSFRANMMPINMYKYKITILFKQKRYELSYCKTTIND